MSAVAQTAPGEVQVIDPPATPDPFLAMIERAARDPAVDIDKMERLMAMRERAMALEARSAYAAALAEMQPKLPVVDRKGSIVIHEKGAAKIPANVIQSTPYALWEDINEAIRPLLAEYGFALSFRLQKNEDRVDVTGVLMHRGGHFEETTLSLPMDTSGSKNNVQAIGSSTSYGKRYTAIALLNITSRGEDDDGKAANAAATLSDEQMKRVEDLMAEIIAAKKANPERYRANFLEYMKAEDVGAIRAKDFDKAIAALESTRKA